jgi:hypothetical protein
MCRLTWLKQFQGVLANQNGSVLRQGAKPVITDVCKRCVGGLRAVPALKATRRCTRPEMKNPAHRRRKEEI